MSTKNKDLYVGIDLGTTFSSLSYSDNNTQCVTMLDFGISSSLSASTVNFTQTPIGVSVENANVIGEVKRFIGLTYDDPAIKTICKELSYKIDKESHNRITIPVVYNGKQYSFYPEEISAFVFSNLKKQLIHKTGVKEINIRAVLCCPVSFNDAQKEATLRAAQYAGIDVVKLIPEPTAAFYFYSIRNHAFNIENDVTKKDTKVPSGYPKMPTEINEGIFLTFDFGGGTLDTTCSST
ncbi:heat shock protein 70kD, putative [Entamoeba invadens IP1]|uniref:Heat shock protein 70kD, putative n=1 Tax=Entamoeba invadens IP1 TaxID=370355 RepID=A0A0A1U9D9_ENTIV|nr:heat shock protein 70kD, putative [Entamoeba invadens IP1]ELP88645.1 heat shock protein 70kD, putative [Entamoeba invadens IP1]|eukprot:XP_004255416.1 heat shock protein 70kD, putative [Entamoeba invadens IP1]